MGSHLWYIFCKLLYLLVRKSFVNDQHCTYLRLRGTKILILRFKAVQLDLCNCSQYITPVAFLRGKRTERFDSADELSKWSTIVKLKRQLSPALLGSAVYVSGNV